MKKLHNYDTIIKNIKIKDNISWCVHFLQHEFSRFFDWRAMVGTIVVDV